MGSFTAVNDWIGPTAEARISPLDNGFVFGDGVYETLRTYGGRPFHMDRHLARLRRSAARLGFAIPPADARLAATTDELLRLAGNAESFIRIIATRGVGDISYRFERVSAPTVVIVAKPFEALPDAVFAEGLKASIVSVRRNSAAALDPAIKSCNLLNNVLAVREAQAKGAAEALLLNDRGDVAEGASSNVFIARGGRLSTPPLDAGILAGITREVILERAPLLGIECREAPLSPAELLAADEAFVSSSLKEAAPIHDVDGHVIGTGRPGPLTLRVLEDFRQYARANSR